MERYIRLALRYRWLVLTLFFGGTVYFGVFLTKAGISSSPGELFFGESPKDHHYIQRNEQFGGDNIAFIAFTGEDLFSIQSLGRLYHVVDDLETDPEIERIESLISVQRIQSADDVLHLDHYADLLAKDPQRKSELLTSLATDPLTRDLIVTQDGRHSIC